MLLALCARRPVPHPKGIPEQSPAAPLLTAHVHLTIRPECPTVAGAYAAHWPQRLAVSVPFVQREDWCRASSAEVH